MKVGDTITLRKQYEEKTPAVITNIWDEDKKDIRFDLEVTNPNQTTQLFLKIGELTKLTGDNIPAWIPNKPKVTKTEDIPTNPGLTEDTVTIVEPSTN